MKLHNYLFDVQLAVSIRVSAESAEAAQTEVTRMLDRAKVVTADADGDPLAFSAAMSDEAPTLVEIDDEPIASEQE